MSGALSFSRMSVSTLIPNGSSVWSSSSCLFRGVWRGVANAFSERFLLCGVRCGKNGLCLICLGELSSTLGPELCGLRGWSGRSSKLPKRGVAGVAGKSRVRELLGGVLGSIRTQSLGFALSTSLN